MHKDSVREGVGMSKMSDDEAPDAMSLVRMYMETLELRMAPAEYNAVVNAAEEFWRAMQGDADGDLDVDQEHLSNEAHREFLMIMAIASTGRLDHEVVEMPTPDGSVGWAVVDEAVAEDPLRLAELRERLGRSLEERDPPQ